jgi:hypothetical protein
MMVRLLCNVLNITAWLYVEYDEVDFKRKNYE